MIDEREDIGGILPAGRFGPTGWLSWAGVVTSGFTAFCCLGVSAALSLATAASATFLTRDSSLRPLLAASLAVTVVGSALTFWRRQRPGPLALTAVAAISVYAFIYLVGGPHGGTGHGDHMADQMSDHATHAAHAGFSGGRLTAVWLGLAVLVAAQVWDLVRIRTGRSPRRQTARIR